MRVKLFSHGADPDGLGCVILAKLIFSNVDFTLCKDPQELNEYYNNLFFLMSIKIMIKFM